MPGKFASRLDGVVVDSKSSEVVAGAKLISRIPHRVESTGTSEVVEVTDKEGRFTLAPEYGIFGLLTLDADLRQIVISKEGYEALKVSVMHQGKDRYVSYASRLDTHKMPRNESLQIKLKKSDG